MNRAVLDAIALVRALQLGDARQAEAVLASCDTAAVARTLAGWLPDACRTQGMVIENFLAVLLDQELQ